MTRNRFFCVWMALILASCAFGDYELSHPPSYDHLIGKRFSDTVFQGQLVFKKVRETETIEELEKRRRDGCVLVFGVRKSDDVIEYWRVDSGPGTCLERRKPLNV